MYKSVSTPDVQTGAPDIFSVSIWEVIPDIYANFRGLLRLQGTVRGNIQPTAW